MAKMQKKSLDSSPDETRTFEKGKIDLVNFGDITIGRARFEPGWSWEKCVKPLVKTESCQAPHTQYIISGRKSKTYFITISLSSSGFSLTN